MSAGAVVVALHPGHEAGGDFKRVAVEQQLPALGLAGVDLRLQGVAETRQVAVPASEVIRIDVGNPAHRLFLKTLRPDPGSARRD